MFCVLSLFHVIQSSVSLLRSGLRYLFVVHSNDIRLKKNGLDWKKDFHDSSTPIFCVALKLCRAKGLKVKMNLVVQHMNNVTSPQPSNGTAANGNPAKKTHFDDKVCALFPPFSSFGSVWVIASCPLEPLLGL